MDYLNDKIYYLYIIKTLLINFTFKQDFFSIKFNRNKSNLKKLLDSPVCHNTFKRLNIEIIELGYLCKIKNVSFYL